MARLPRYVAPGQPQHVIQRGNNRSAIFADARDHHVFHDYLGEACERHGTQVHAYVLMTNHVHLIMTPCKDNGIGKVMQAVGRRYVQYFNRRQGRTGTLWEGRYRATLIDSDRYLLTCYRYVELNPVRAGLVAHPAQYRWSSYGANAFGHHDPLITAHERYSALGSGAEDRQAAYRTLFRSVLDERTVAEIREATNKAWALATPCADNVLSPFNRRTHPLSRGGNHRINRV